MPLPTDLPILFFDSQPAWENWLAVNHAASPGLWLKMAKKNTGIPSIDYAQALEVALCYGWIDSQKGSFDAQYFLQRFTPRKAQSPWSKINREKAEALIASGRMRPAGLEQVQRAQADGRWEAAYASQSQIEVPPDLQAELDADPAAAAFFASLNSVNRYAILYRLHSAKKPETRASRLAKFVDMLRKGEKIYP